MSKSIHICPVGFYPEPVLAVFGSGIPCDKFYFLYNDHESSIAALEIIEDSMRRMGQMDLNEIEIDPFDYSNIISTILSIIHSERKKDPGNEFYINFTSGTNIVAGACCSSSYFIGATLYYVLNPIDNPRLTNSERVRIIKTPRIPDMEKMKPFAQQLLLKICDSDEGYSMNELREYMGGVSAQKIDHHLNSFLNSGLITKEKRSGRMILKRTEQGRMFSTWIDDD